MKYIGENAIKKLISLIKGDLATKQDSIAATGVLERDTTGVINGVETVGATLVETQEATLVDVPNGLLKGDGTTISVAVAGTDYVNSNQAIRYDAAQTLTDEQKQQARENIFAAPADKFPYFSAYTGDAMEKTFEVPSAWRTYLVVSTYLNKLGMWMVLPNGNVVVPIVENSAVTITCEAGKIHIKGAYYITIIYLGNS